MEDEKIKPINLSIVIPTVNSEDKIEKTIIECRKKCWLYKGMGLIDKFEIRPIAQISDDGTFVLLHLYDNDKLVHPSYLSKRGKGLACTFGLRVAKYEWVMIFDDDLNYNMNFLLDAIPLCNKYDIIIAARIGRKNMPFIRKIASFTYRKFAQRLFDLKGINDIQAGQKLMRKDLFGFVKSYEYIGNRIYMTEHGFVWDTELLYKAKKLGYKIAEVGIVYTYEENFLKLNKAWLSMGYDLLKLKFKKEEDEDDRRYDY